MSFVDFQIHLPTDLQKGEYLGYNSYNQNQWAEDLENAQKRYDEELYIVPTVTNRGFNEADSLYIEALEDTKVNILGRGIEVERAGNSFNIIGESIDYNIFQDIEEDATSLIEAGKEHIEEYFDSFMLLSHPFSKEGGILRNKSAEDYELSLIRDIDRIASDHHSNAWINTFREQPWKFLNDVDEDRFGLTQDYDDLNLELQDIGSSDVKDASLAGSSVSYVPEKHISSVEEAYNEAITSEFEANLLPSRVILRKIASGIGPIKSLSEK